MNELIKAEHLSYAYASDTDERTVAIRDINLSIHEGEYVAILGHNGSGKSTLAKLFNMILEPTEGTVVLFGRDVTAEDFTEDDLFALRRDIGMVFQNPDNQLVATVVEEDVAFGPENIALEREEIRRRVNMALDRVGMTDYARHAPHKLSGGQKQRVAIAGVLALKPRLIIFDESTAMLDPLGRSDVMHIMEDLNRKEGITILNITHYMDEAARADRVVVMDDGKIAMDGTPREIFSRVEELRAMGLEAPQSSELAYRLRKAGIPIEGTPLSPEECANAILSAWEDMK